MDPEYIINRDDIGTTASSSSLSSPLLNIRGGGEEQQTISQHENSEFETTQVTNSTRCNSCCRYWHNIPTLVYILVPMILIFIAIFLAAAFIPPHH
jgi:hypothetical protein